MAYNPWEEQDPFGTYQEPVDPMTLMEYLSALGDTSKGIAGGAVRAPHVMAKGIDDIIDAFKGQDASKDSAVVKGTSILDQLANKIVPENEIGKVSSEMIGENMLTGAMGRGAITVPKVMGATTATLAPAVVQEEGERLGLTPEQTLAATLFAGAAPTAINVPSKRDIFAGQTARNADLDMLDKAEEMRVRGVPARDIWVETGVTFGTDGLPRFEIPDASATLRGDRPGRTITGSDGMSLDFNTPILMENKKFMSGDATLGEVLDHPQLFEAYPDLARYKIQPLDDEAVKKGVRGSYNPKTKTVKVAPGLSTDEAISTVLHETQHVVQGKEGFSVGANMAFADHMMAAADYAIKNFNNNAKTLKAKIADAKKEGADPELISGLEDLRQQYVDMRNDAFAFRDRYKFNRGQIYRDTFGEAEARMVQERLRQSKAGGTENPYNNYPLDYLTDGTTEKRFINREGGEGKATNMDWYSFFYPSDKNLAQQQMPAGWLTQEEIKGWTDAYGNPVNTDDIIQTRIAGTSADIAPLERTTDAGYLKNPLLEKINAGEYDPTEVTKAKATAMNKAANENPVFAAMEAARSGGGKIDYVDNMYAKATDFEKLAQMGRPIIPLPADKTSVGMVKKIGGVELKTPIRTEGGPMHSEWQGDWASMNDAASGKQLHANKVADETGQLPIYMYLGMDHEGSNFSTMASEGVLRYLESAGDLTKEGKKRIDEIMRSLPDTKDTKGIADSWPGYKSWDQTLEWLTNQDIGGKTTVGNRRKAFMNAISNKEFEQYGAPNMDDVYAAINEPSISGYGSGMAGFRAADAVYADPKNMEHRPQGHGSYDTRIQLGDVYAMDPAQMTPWNLMFHSMAEARKEKAPARAARSVQTSGGKLDYQIPDEQWAMRILDYLQRQGQAR